jgi:multidrug resistance efflux pump
MILTAPQSGIISKVSKAVGEITSSGVPILNIYTGDRLWVEVYPSSDNAALIRPGSRMQVLLDSAGWTRLEARIQGILPVMQNQQTSTVFGSMDATYAVVLLEFENLDKAKSLVRKGQKVTAVLAPETGQ